GEPGAVKAARPVREEVARKRTPTQGVPRRAAYFTPTLIRMTPYYHRPEAAELAGDQREWESIIAAQALARAEAAFGSTE
ncbi:MAG TPA: hypothetical protein VIM19_12395, partial [Actinomycetes bacterium]